MAEEEAEKIMANIPIDRDMLREHIRKLPGDSRAEVVFEHLLVHAVAEYEACYLQEVR